MHRYINFHLHTGIESGKEEGVLGSNDPISSSKNKSYELSTFILTSVGQLRTYRY